MSHMVWAQWQLDLRFINIPSNPFTITDKLDWLSQVVMQALYNVVYEAQAHKVKFPAASLYLGQIAFVTRQPKTLREHTKWWRR